MIKRLTSLLVLGVLLSGVALSQWTQIRSYTPFHSYVKPDNLWGLHGMAVDPEGKIWVAPYDATDSLTLGSSSLLKRREIFVFHPDGTPASFSPIKIIMGDSLNNDNSGRGMTSDQNGNILYASFNRLFRIDYKTGLGLAKNDSIHSSSIGAPGVDSAGNIYVHRVVSGNRPLHIYGSDLSLVGNAVDSTTYILRSLAVNGAGTRIYVPNIYSSNPKVWVYENSAGPGFGAYSLVDSVFEGFQSEAIGWQPLPGNAPRLWASGGSMENPPTAASGANANTWYGIDFATYNAASPSYVDSIRWDYTFPGNPTFDDTVANAQRPRPRGIVFTASGDTAYVGMFLADSNSVKMFIRTSLTKVDRVGEAIPNGYDLTQNYPNPFNPSTEIRFDIGKDGFTTLRVFDMLGREVSQLVSEELIAGTYTATFNASDLPSGTYFYELVSGDVRMAKKMVLMK
jgi:hypothetical protein